MTVPQGFVLSGDPVTAARSLLGAILRHGEVAVRVTEVEAYGGGGDAASHTFRGPTARNATMFGPPGHLYVYLSYGIHWNANVSCAAVGIGAGVLLRAGEVVEGIGVARSRRGHSTDRDLARGPGRLCQALAISKERDGDDVISGTAPVRLCPPPTVIAAESVSTGPRVGVSREAERPWRFWLAGDRYVSAYKRSPRA
ncbi:MAG: DNA-3-methyladenine glycosylase [Propionibacteriaceae bacterium]